MGGQGHYEGTMLDTVNVGHGAVALGIGMLVGLERERRKGRNERQAAAGLRTFAITALLGYLSMVLAGAVLVAVASLALVLMLCAHYRKHVDNDPDITSEIALLLVLTLGALSLNEPELAAAAGVVLTVLLALRRELHHFVLQQLSEEELRNGLMLSTVALVVLPLTPDHFLGPYNVLNPRTICNLVVLLMAVGALGHIAMRLMGPRYGLPLSSIASGFASSTATIALLAHRARQQGSAARSFAGSAYCPISPASPSFPWCWASLIVACSSLYGLRSGSVRWPRLCMVYFCWRPGVRLMAGRRRSRGLVRSVSGPLWPSPLP